MTDHLAEIDNQTRRLRALANALALPHFQAGRLIEIAAEIERSVEAARLEAALAAGQSVCIEPGTAQAERLISIEYDAEGNERARFYQSPGLISRKAAP
jgi:hypothetical protein